MGAKSSVMTSLVSMALSEGIILLLLFNMTSKPSPNVDFLIWQFCIQTGLFVSRNSLTFFDAVNQTPLCEHVRSRQLWCHYDEPRRKEASNRLPRAEVIAADTTIARHSSLPIRGTLSIRAAFHAIPVCMSLMASATSIRQALRLSMRLPLRLRQAHRNRTY